MQITGISADDFSRIVSGVSALDYANNLTCEVTDLGGKRAPRIRARVLVNSTGAREGLPISKTLPGVRRSANQWNLPSHGYPARVHAACWHAYRDVLVALFERYPEAKVRTAMAQYIGQDGFYQNYPETGNKNIGSMMAPLRAAAACDCDKE